MNDNESGQFDNEVKSYQLWNAYTWIRDVYGVDMDLDEFIKVCDDLFGKPSPAFEGNAKTNEVIA